LFGTASASRWQDSRAAAILAGVLTGLVVYRFYKQIHPEVAGYGIWGIEQFEVALAVAAAGLAGVFASAWRTTLGITLGAVITAVTLDYLQAGPAVKGDFMIPRGAVVLFAPLYMLVTFPAAAVGMVTGRVLRRRWPPVLPHLITLGLGIAIAALMPYREGVIRSRVETHDLPELFRRVHDAEMVLGGDHAGTAFTCNPAELVPLKDLTWRFSRATLEHNRYELQLDCGQLGLPGYRIYATSVPVTDPRRVPTEHFALYMDETGELLRGAAISRTLKDRLETHDLPSFLRRLHTAETSYRASSPEKTFTCDGTRLPGLASVRWGPKANELWIDAYRLEMTCSGTDRFRAVVKDEYPFRYTLAIDETGQLTGGRGR
jgi:hypothetical protein